jgi:hypothetical protein
MMSLTVKRETIFSNVKSPARVWKLRINIDTEGRNKNMMANKKKGATPNHAQFSFRVWGRACGASPLSMDNLVTSVTTGASDSYSP